MGRTTRAERTDQQVLAIFLRDEEQLEIDHRGQRDVKSVQKKIKLSIGGRRCSVVAPAVF